MIRLARAKNLLTTPYVFSEADAAAMAKAGADIIVCHLGLTTGARSEPRRAEARGTARPLSTAGLRLRWR